MSRAFLTDAQTPLLSVGVLAADQLHLAAQIEQLEGIPDIMLHIDVMDGVFVPQLTVGPSYVKMLPRAYVKDVHLLVDDPLRLIDVVVEAGATLVSFHLESTRHPARVLEELGAAGSVARGVALNPGTPVSLVEPLLGDLEFLLLLGVNPGWPSRYLPSTDARLAEARALADRHHLVVGVDGGISSGDVTRVVELGADLVVSGSAVFSADDPRRSALDMLAAARRAYARRGM